MLAVSGFVVRHKLLVVVFWLAVLVAGGAAASGLGGRLSQEVAIPGAAGYEANQQILRLYGNGGDGYPEVAVVTLPSGESAGSAAGSQALGLVFTPYAGEGTPSLAPQITAAMTAQLPEGSMVRVTGMNELRNGGQARQG